MEFTTKEKETLFTLFVGGPKIRVVSFDRTVQLY